jgi:hypothetical protein
LNKRREVVVQKKADAAVVSCWIFQPFESKCARVSRSWLPFKIHTMYWAAVTAAMANTMEKRGSKVNASRNSQRRHLFKCLMNTRGQIGKAGAIGTRSPAASREYFSK